MSWRAMPVAVWLAIFFSLFAGCAEPAEVNIPFLRIGDVALYEETSSTRETRPVNAFPPREWVRYEVVGESNYIDRYLRPRASVLLQETRADSEGNLTDNPRLAGTYHLDALTGQVGGVAFGPPRGVDLEGQYFSFWTAETWQAYGLSALSGRSLTKNLAISSDCTGPQGLTHRYRLTVERVQGHTATVRWEPDGEPKSQVNYPGNLCVGRIWAEHGSPWPTRAEFAWTQVSPADNWNVTHEVIAERKEMRRGDGMELRPTFEPANGSSPFLIKKPSGSAPGFDVKVNNATLEDFVRWAKANNETTKSFLARRPGARVVEGSLRAEELSTACPAAAVLPFPCRLQRAVVIWHSPSEDLTLSMTRVFRTRDDGSLVHEQYHLFHSDKPVPLRYEPTRDQEQAASIKIEPVRTVLALEGFALRRVEVRQQNHWPRGILGFEERMYVRLVWTPPGGQPDRDADWIDLNSKNGHAEFSTLGMAFVGNRGDSSRSSVPPSR